MILLLLSVSVRIDTLLTNNTLQTNHKNILVNSDTIFAGDSSLYRNIDYTVDYPNGRIRFFRVYRETLHIIFTSIGNEYPNHFQRFKPSKAVNRTQKSVKDSFEITGKNGFFMDVSGDGTGFTHSLDINLRGKIKDYSVNGKINSSQFPYQYGIIGLNQVDNIYMEITRKDMGIRLGNFGSPTDIRKEKLTGIKVWLKGFGFSGGFTGNVERSIFLNIEEGVPGPYRLTDESGKRVWVIKGSVRVYRNGKLLKEGKKGDYTVNYQKGEITFTPIYYPRKEDVIQVIFQYVPGGKNESIYSLSYTETGKKLLLERRNDLLEDILIHKTVPESGYVYIYTAQYTGPGMGDYNLVDSHFVYAGNMKGSYTVDFQYVGGDSGEYVFLDSLGYYLYQGHGDWSALRKLSLDGEVNTIYLDVKEEKGKINVNLNCDAEMVNYPGKEREYKGVYIGGVGINPAYGLELSIKGYFRRGENFRYLEMLQGQERSNWGIPIQKSVVGDLKFRPSEGIEMSLNAGKGNERLKKGLTIKIGKISMEYLDVDLYKRTAEISGRLRGLEIGGMENVQENLYRRFVFIGSKNIRLEAGREGEEITGYKRDTSAFYLSKLNINGYVFSLTGNGVMRKSLTSGKRKIELNISPSLRIGKGTSRLSLSGLISEHLENKMLAVYTKVGNGMGNYSYDSLSGEYYPNPFGNYIRTLTPSDSMERIRRYRIKGVGTVENPIFLKFSGTEDIRGGDILEEVSMNLVFPFWKWRPFVDVEHRYERFTLLDMKKDDMLKQNVEAGIRISNLKLSAGTGLNKEERRRFLKASFSGIAGIKMETGDLRIKENRLYYMDIQPEIGLNKSTLSMEMNIYHYIERIQELPMYQEGISFTVRPMINLLIGNFTFSITGFYRTLPESKPLYYIRFGGETKI